MGGSAHSITNTFMIQRCITDKKPHVYLLSCMQVNEILYKLEEQGLVDWSERAPGGRRQWSLAQAA